MRQDNQRITPVIQMCTRLGEDFFPLKHAHLQCLWMQMPTCLTPGSCVSRLTAKNISINLVSTRASV